MVGRSAEVRPARVDRVLGSRLFVAGSMRSTGSRLRILAFHGVGDVVAFGRQLDVVAETSNPVSSGDVCDWLGGRGELPRRAVWITFDDGEPSAVVDAAPALAARGIRATVFVCPAFVGGLVRPWWQVVDDALAAGLAIPDGLGVASLKVLGDDRRRSVVASLAVALDSVDADRRPAGRRVLNLDDLRRWRDLGGDVGSHTWDHPCLDRCSPEAQRSQIDRAAAWLDEHELWDRRVFAYPNGSATSAAAEHLASAGYAAALLFDHRLVARRADPLRLSRLRIDAGASDARTRAIVGGGHGALLAARRRMIGR